MMMTLMVRSSPRFNSKANYYIISIITTVVLVYQYVMHMIVGAITISITINSIMIVYY